MKKANSILLIILLVMAGCGEGSKQSTDDLIVVDVTKSYPKKELILQDFMDVEYIVLETSDDFLTQGSVQDIGKDILLVINRFNDGDIFVFDRTGKGIRKINRKGQGGEEYTSITGIILDEHSSEMFVNNLLAKKICVYDLYGNFKRSFNYKDVMRYRYINDYDRDHLICYDGTIYREDERSAQSFLIISKQDGSTIKDIEIPYKQAKLPHLLLIGENDNRIFIADFFPQIPYNDNWILTSPSSDTIFSYSPNHTLKPFIARTPSIHSMDPEVFLFQCIPTNHYYFMETAKKEYNNQTQTGFQTKQLVYDIRDKTICEYVVYNRDYADKTETMTRQPLNNEIAFYTRLETYELVEAYEQGKLKGRLKEIAAELNAESNPVIMLVKHKK